MLETPLLLRKVDKETAQESLNLLEPLQNLDEKEIMKYFDYCVVLPRNYQEKDVESRDNYLTFRNDNCIGFKQDYQHFPKVIQELKEIIGKEEKPTSECSKNSPCQICKDELQRKLNDCKD